MSSAGQAPSSSNFHLIINALADYAKQTGIDLIKNPFAEKIELSNSPEAILELFREREKAFEEYRKGNRRLESCLSSAVKVLHTFSGILGPVSLVPFPPAKAVFTGIDVLLAAACGFTSSYDALLELFERLGDFLKRLEIYTMIPPSTIMMDIIIKIMVEVLSVLALATKEIKQGRFKNFVKKLLGKSEVEAVLQRLDRLTESEAQMTAAQTLHVAHGLVGNVSVVVEDGKASTRYQLQKDVQHWLSPPDPSTNHDFVLKAHHTGTTSWFFKSGVLTEWKGDSSFLWIHGKPGSGKSTLLSAIIQHIEGMCAGGLATLAYYYFDFRDVKKQDRYGLLSSLVSQLSAELDPCYKILSQLYSDHASGTRRPTTSTLTKCLKAMLSIPGQGPIYIIVDALDECPDLSGTPSAREEVLELVQELVDMKLSNLHLCVASRPEVDIRKTLEPLKPLQISLHDETGQKDDIIKYINSVVHSDKKMRSWRDEDKELVVEVLSEKADGMFRWVVCQFDRLRRSFPASIRSFLADIPESLDKTYEQTLLGIDKEKRRYAQRLFQCLSVSIRPLRAEELAEILAVQFDATAASSFNEGLRPLDAEEAVLSACSSLIALVDKEGGQVVQFSHSSVKEFLTSDRLATADERLSCFHILPEPAHALLAHACLSVLLRLDEKIDRDAIGHFPLALYAARYWVDHSRFGSVASRIEGVMEHLFDRTKPHFAAWVWLFDIDRPWVDPMSSMHPTQPEAVPLYYASLCGFGGLVGRLLVSNSLDANSRGGSHTTPLHASSIKGHLDASSLLLGNGADPNSRDNRGRAPLHRVSQGGQLIMAQSSLKIARLLVDFGANVGVTGDEGWTPLHTAARSGYRDIAELLLESGASLGAQNENQETPLHVACGNGKLDLSRFLIDRGSDINSRDKGSMFPLHSASRYGHLDIARLLLDCGSDVNARETRGWTPLIYASRNGYLGLARLLIDSGSDVNAREIQLWTPLHMASRYGHLGLARLLIDSGADLNVYQANCWTALHLASNNGHFEIAKLLVERGENVNSQNDKKEAPLNRAAGKGCLDTVRFLIERGAMVSARDNKGWTAFHTASYCGHVHITKYLLECGIDVDIRNEGGETPLYLASSRGKLDVVLFLIKNGANIHASDNKGSNPLHTASEEGHINIVRTLINTGFSVNIQNGTQMTPLALASSEGRIDVGRFLVERGADVNAWDNESWAPIHLASRCGHHDMVQLLLDHGVDTNVQKGDLWSPLHLSSVNNHLKVAEFLLQRGASSNMFNDNEETPLFLAAGYGKVAISRLLIDYGANLHFTDSRGWTPLHTASHGGHLRVVKLLLGRGADVNALNKTNQTAAELALENDKAEVATFIEEYKADVNIRNQIRSTTSDTAQYCADEDEKDEGEASLHAAAEEGKVDVVKSLLERGVDVNCRNTGNQAPLDRAAYKGNVDVVRLLLERGAMVDSHDKWGWTTLHVASRYGHLDVSRVLIDHGAKVNARQQNHWTPIHLSTNQGHLGVVELLLERGADVHAVNGEGDTSYQLSLRIGNREIEYLLRQHGACRESP